MNSLLLWRLRRSVEIKSYRIVVAIEKEARGRGYSAYSPTLPGCFSNGRTVQEARRNIRAALRLHIRSLVAHRQPVPTGRRLVRSEAMTIRVPRLTRTRPGIEPTSVEPVYQLKITLKAIEPPIWRRVLVRGGILMPRLHTVIQRAMGWRDAHLHEFSIRDVRYGEPEPDEPHYKVEPERDFSLREVVPRAGLRFEYVYDLGDGWLHDVLVERIDLPAESLRSPVCLAGERACPPEDCGGFPGYEDLLGILRDPDHPEHEDRLDWLGGSFDPEAFDLAAVNRKLRSH